MAVDYRKSARALASLATKRAKARAVGKSHQNKLRTTERIEEAAASGQTALDTVRQAGLVDDPGTTPGAATGIVITPFGRALGIGWTPAPGNEYVEQTTVELTHTATGTVTTRTTDETGMEFEHLLLSPYTVRIAHINRWGRQGAWGTAGPATPLPTAADRITAATSIAAGEISNLLNDPGLAALTDPDKLAEAVVRSAALSTATTPNLLPFNEAEYNGLPLGALGGAGVDAGVTATIVDAPTPRRWLSVARATGAAGMICRPFPAWRNRLEGQTGGAFFLSFEARNTGVAPVRVGAVVEQSADGVAVSSTAAGAYVSVPPGGTSSVWVKFDAASATPNQRYGIVLPDAGATILVNRVMLQRASATKTEPGVYHPPGISTGVVSAQLIAAWDVAAGRAIIAQATINQALMADAAIGNAQIDRATVNKLQVLSADITSLAVDKMVAGTFKGGQMFLSATGFLSTPGDDTRLDDGGLTLKASGSIGTPAVDKPTKVSVVGDYAALGFFNNGAQRGISQVADGNPTGVPGLLDFAATRGGDRTPVTAAVLQLISKTAAGDRGGAFIQNALEVAGPMTASGTVGDITAHRDIAVGRNLSVAARLIAPYTQNPANISPNASLPLSHGLGTTPRYMIYQWLQGSVWRTLSDNVDTFRLALTDASVTVVNNHATDTRQVKGVLIV